MPQIEMIYTDIFNFQYIKECKIEKSVNNHGHASIKGVLHQKERVVDKIKEKTWVTLYSENEHGKRELFSGLVESLSIEEINGLRECEIELIGGTMLMDIEMKTRTFQNSAMSYEALFMMIGEGHNATKLGENLGSSLGDFYVQYNETDWNFLMRMASNISKCIIPEFVNGKIVYRVGLEAGTNAIHLNEIEYKKKQEVNCLRQYGSQLLRNTEVDNVIEFKAKDVFELGQKVIAEKETYYVYNIETVLEKEEVIHKYDLRKKADFEIKKHYNFMIVGASLNAKIIDVKAASVKVCVSVDGTQDTSTARWFPYSSVFSSPDGTGWYCMPEKGDDVRMYFPSEKEHEAYIISSVHVGEGAGARTNPNNKSLMNKFNKQVELTPTTITLTNGKGMSFVLDDEKGITIESDKDINFVAAENVQIVSLTQKVDLAAANEVSLSQRNNSIKLNGDIQLSAGELKIQR